MPRKQTPTFETENRTFPTRLRYAMELRGKNQTQLAKEIGVQRQTVSLYTTGQSSPDAERIILISKALDVSPNFLLGFTASPDVQPSAADELGLSEKAIECIKNLDCLSKDTFNLIFDRVISQMAFSSILHSITSARMIIQNSMSSAYDLDKEEEAIMYADKVVSEAYPHYPFSIIDSSQLVDFRIFEACTRFEEILKDCTGYHVYANRIIELKYSCLEKNAMRIKKISEGD